MDLEESKISMICMISCSDFNLGRLSLPLPFYCEYRDELPVNLKLHVSSGDVWHGKFVQQSKCIEGLEQLMGYHQIRPFHFAMLHYIGGPDFNLQVYTPYGVEMDYAKSIFHPKSNRICSDLEVDQLASTYRYNVKENFVRLYNLQIYGEHLYFRSYSKVLDEYGCNQLGLSNKVKSIKLGFENREWKIKLKWVNDEPYFDGTWFDFVEAAKILLGDVVVFYKTCHAFKFKICIFESKTLAEESFGGDVPVSSSFGNCFKVMTSESLEHGQLELPRLFRNNYGHLLDNVINIELGGDYSTQFRYCYDSSKIHGLYRFIGKYSIKEGYFLFFKYLGNSTVALSVYDTQGMDHLRNNLGYLRLEDFSNPPYDTELFVISSDSDDNVLEAEEEIDEGLIFNVTLKKSHVDEQCHGAYIPPCMWSVYGSWGKRTTLKLNCEGRQWNVDALRNNRSCRFGRGWNEFTLDNNLATGQVLSFQFIGDFSFNVKCVG